MKPFFFGDFYVATKFSVYQVKVPKDLVTSPKVRKMAKSGESTMTDTPVTGYLFGGFYVGLTAEGLIRYRAKRHQHAPLSGALPPRLEQLKGRWTRAMRTSHIVGLFMKRDDADDCISRGCDEAFDSQWHNQTREVLANIGYFHPLVTLSREGEYALPTELLPPNDSV